MKKNLYQQSSEEFYHLALLLSFCLKMTTWRTFYLRARLGSITYWKVSRGRTSTEVDTPVNFHA